MTLKVNDRVKIKHNHSNKSEGYILEVASPLDIHNKGLPATHVYVVWGNEFETESGWFRIKNLIKIDIEE